MTAARLVYPDSDGELLADNTEHFTFIMTVQGNLRSEEHTSELQSQR